MKRLLLVLCALVFQGAWGQQVPKQPLNKFPTVIFPQKGIWHDTTASVPLPDRVGTVSHVFPYAGGLAYYTAAGLVQVPLGMKITSGPGLVMTPYNSGSMLSLSQYPNLTGDIVHTSAWWNPGTLPALKSGASGMTILAVDESTPGQGGLVPTVRLPLSSLGEGSARRWVPVPASPTAPGTPGDYSTDATNYYEYAKIDPYNYKWLSWAMRGPWSNTPTAPAITLAGTYNPTTQAADLTWAYAPTAQTFEVYASLGDSLNFKRVSVIEGSARAGSIDVAQATTYFIRIRAINTDLSPSSFSPTIILTTPAPVNQWAPVASVLTTPNNSLNKIVVSFYVPEAGGHVRLDMTKNLSAQAAPSDPTVQGWAYYRDITITNAGSYSIDVTGIYDSDPRLFRVLRYGDGKSDAPWAKYGPAYLSNPVSDLATISGTSGQDYLTLNWGGGPAGALYTVERNADGSNWVEIISSSTSVTSTRTWGVSGTEQYRVKYRRPEAPTFSAYSEVLTLVRPSGSGLIAPGLIITQRAIDRGIDHPYAFTMEWTDPNSDETGYEVYFNGSSGFYVPKEYILSGQSPKRATLPANSRTYTLNVDHNGPNFTVSVRAVRGNVVGPFAPPIQFRNVALTGGQPYGDIELKNNYNVEAGIKIVPDVIDASPTNDIQWWRSSGVLGQTDNQTVWVPWKKTKANVTNLIDSTATTPGRYYYYRGRMLAATTGVGGGYSNDAIVLRTDVVNPSYFEPTLADLTTGYDPFRFFTQKTYSREVSPFTNNRWINPIGTAISYGNVVSLGYGLTDIPTSVPKINKGLELSEDGTLGQLGIPKVDPDAIGVGQSFTTDEFGVVVPTDDHKKYNFWKVVLANIGNGNPTYGFIRWDLEMAPFSTPYKKFFITQRQVLEGGKYRKTANGGTDPYWAGRSDDQYWQEYLDKVTQTGVTLYKNAIASMGSDGTPIWTTCYGIFGDKNSDIWNRVVSIGGVPQPTLNSLNTVSHSTDMIVGHYTYRLMWYSSDPDPQEQGWKWVPMDRAIKPMAGGVVTGKPSRLRIWQTNAITSTTPHIRARLEDENGNLCKDENNIPYQVIVTFKSGTKPAAEANPLWLRTENGLVPDGEIDVKDKGDNSTPVLSWWKVHSDWQNINDYSLANWLTRSHSDKDPDGRYVFNQLYAYMDALCCEMFGTCASTPNGGFGQCEDNTTVGMSTNYITSRWAFGLGNKIKTLFWQARDGVNSNKKGVWANYKFNVGGNTRTRTYKSLQTYEKYAYFYQSYQTFSKLQAEISYDNGATWLSHADYMLQMKQESADNPRAAVSVDYNADLGKVLIAGTPLYVGETGSISVQVRYTVPGKPQRTRTLNLTKNNFEDGFVFAEYDAN